jgi:hypothetical protein
MVPVAFSSEVGPVRVSKNASKQRAGPGSDSIRTDQDPMKWNGNAITWP